MNCKCGKPFVKHYGTSTTLVGYGFLEGHDHDDNCRSRIYVCEDGHETALHKQNRCPACDWEGKTECFCHEGPKIREWPEGVPFSGREEAMNALFGR